MTARTQLKYPNYVWYTCFETINDEKEKTKPN